MSYKKIVNTINTDWYENPIHRHYALRLVTHAYLFQDSISDSHLSTELITNIIGTDIDIIKLYEVLQYLSGDVIKLFNIQFKYINPTTHTQYILTKVQIKQILAGYNISIDDEVIDKTNIHILFTFNENFKID